MSYTIDPIDSTIITVNPGSYIDDILTSNESGLTFNFLPGNYYLTDILNITRDNVKFTNTTLNTIDVHIFQTNDQKDGINVVSNNIIIEYISIHVTTNNRIALTAASANNCLIQNNYIYGNKTTFSVYFAGPKSLTTGESTLNGYTNNILDSNNIFKNNVVYSQWSGDAVSFSLQNYGTFTNNIIRGGKLAIYMCKNSNFLNNIIYDSIDSGIYISLPSENLNITSNKIYECIASGIKIMNQLEHGPFTPVKTYIVIKNNYIYDSKTNAIELNNTIKCSILGNKLISSDSYGVYIYNSSEITVQNNKIAYFNVGIWFEVVTNSKILTNKFMSVYPDEGQNIVKLTTGSNKNTISKNISYGKIIYDHYIIPLSTTENILSGNVHKDYYTITEEINMLK